MEVSVFDGVYLHYSDKLSEPESEESIAKRIQSTKQRLNEITKKEKKISPEMFERYFGYPNPSYIFKALSKTKNSGENKAQVNIIENRLPNLIQVLKSSPTSNVKKIKNRNNLLEFVERILYFNQLNQLGKRLKILTPNQMLSRLPISLT